MNICPALLRNAHDLFVRVVDEADRVGNLKQRVGSIGDQLAYSEVEAPFLEDANLKASQETGQMMIRFVS